MKTFDEWKEAGRGVRSGAVGYTALIGQDYTREDGTAASGYYVGKKFDVSQTRGRQPDRAPVYAADELVTALFTNSPVRLAVSEAVPEGIQAQYAAQNRTIYVRNNMDAQTTLGSPPFVRSGGKKMPPVNEGRPLLPAALREIYHSSTQHASLYSGIPFRLRMCMN